MLNSKWKGIAEQYITNMLLYSIIEILILSSRTNTKKLFSETYRKNITELSILQFPITTGEIPSRYKKEIDEYTKLRFKMIFEDIDRISEEIPQ